MGKSASKKSKADDKFKAQYIRFLRTKQKKFLRAEQQNTANRLKSAQFSFISDAGIDEVDWKLFFEDFLQEHADTCFWVGSLLKYLMLTHQIYIDSSKLSSLHPKNAGSTSCSMRNLRILL